MLRYAVITVACLLAISAGAAEISGRIYTKAPLNASLCAGYVGLASGEELTCFAGTTMSTGTTEVTCTTYSPRETTVRWNPGTYSTYSHTNLPTGRYLVYVQYDDWYYDWQVVEVPANASTVSVNFSVNTEKAGNVAINIVRPGNSFSIRLTPYGDDNAFPLTGTSPGYAFGNEESVDGSSLTMRNVKTGTYLLELRAEEKHDAGGGGSWSTYTDIGSWIIKVKPGKTQRYNIP